MKLYQKVSIYGLLKAFTYKKLMIFYVRKLSNYFNNKEVKKEQKMGILAISKENIDDKLKIIKLNVLGIKYDEK